LPRQGELIAKAGELLHGAHIVYASTEEIGRQLEQKPALTASGRFDEPMSANSIGLA
jgi:hypothetical protein